VRDSRNRNRVGVVIQLRRSEEAISTLLFRAADLLESAVSAVQTAFAGTASGYEADVEANLMIHLTIRNVEGVALPPRKRVS
jgi:hypothetical protein